jgi:hypothetical protein
MWLSATNGVIKMDLRQNMLEGLAQAKRDNQPRLVSMLEAQLERMDNPVSAESLYRTGPMVNRRDKSEPGDGDD